MAQVQDSRLLKLRYSALCGIAAAPIFTMGIVIADLAWDEYSHRTQLISDLGGTAAPHPWLQNVNFVVFGLLVAAFAIGLGRSVGRRPAGRAGALLIAYFGVAFAALGFFPCTPGCAEGTASDLMHSLTVVSGLLAFMVGTFLLSRRMKDHPEWRPYARYSLLTAVGTLAGFVFSSIAFGVDPERLQAGILQRLLVGIILAWLGLVAARLFRLPADAAGPPPESSPQAAT